MVQPVDPGYLGSRVPSEVVLSAANLYVPGSWLATFKPQDMPPEPYDVYHASMRGPRGGFLVYIDDEFYSAHSRSDLNEYDPKQVMHMRPGQAITFHFKSADPTSRPLIWVRLKRPTVVL